MLIFMHMCADLIYVCMPRLNPVRLTKSTRKNLIEIEQTIIDRCKACKKKHQTWWKNIVFKCSGRMLAFFRFGKMLEKWGQASEMQTKILQQLTFWLRLEGVEDPNGSWQPVMHNIIYNDIPKNIKFEPRRGGWGVGGVGCFLFAILMKYEEKNMIWYNHTISI